MSSSEGKRIKSWPGLLVGLIGVLAAVGAWIQTGQAAPLLGAVGFAFLTVVFSKIPLSFNTPLREAIASGSPLSRADGILFWTGFTLISVSMALGWLL